MTFCRQKFVSREEHEKSLTTRVVNMARVLLGVTGSVAADRTPAFFDAIVRSATMSVSLRQDHRFTSSTRPSWAGPGKNRPMSRRTGRSFAIATNRLERAIIAAMKCCTSNSVNGQTLFWCAPSMPTRWPSSLGISDNFLSCVFRVRGISPSRSSSSGR